MRAATFSIAILLALAIVLPGIAFLSGTVRAARKSDWINVGPTGLLPDDGTPQFVFVRVARADAWTRLPDEVVGRAYLRRVPHTGAVVALNGRHSRYGVAVVFDDAKQVYRCRCWDLEFDLDGKPLQANGLSDGMRALDAKVVAGDVFIRKPTDWR